MRLNRLYPNTKVLFCLLFSCFKVLVSPAFSADLAPVKNSDNLKISDALPYGPSRCVVVKDNLVFTANGGAILIYETGNMALPDRMAEIRTFGIIMKMAVRGDLLYVAAGSDGMYVFDIKDCRSPKSVIHLPFERWCSSIFISGNLLFLGQQGSLKVFNINNSNPADITFFKELSIQGQAEDFLIKENFLFVSCRSGGLYIFDLNNDFKNSRHIFKRGKTTYALADFQKAVYFNMGESVYALELGGFSYKKVISLPKTKKIYFILIRENYAYVSFDEQIYCFQIDSPSCFRYKGKESLPSDHVRQAVLYKNYMYASAEDAGLMIFDISNPGSLILKSRIDTPGEISGLVVHEDSLFVADYKGLSIYDIKGHLKLESSLTSFMRYPGISKVRIEGKHIFILHEYPNGGPAFVEILEMPGFRKIKSIKFPGEIYDIQVYNNQLFVICQHNFYVYDIKTVRSPRLEYKFSMPGYLRCINIYHGDVFITDYRFEDTDPGLLLFAPRPGVRDRNRHFMNRVTANPLGAAAKNALDADYFDKLLLYDKYVYVTRDRKLYVFSNDDGTLAFLHSVLLPDNVRDLSAQRERNVIYLYLALEDAGLRVLKQDLR